MATEDLEKTIEELEAEVLAELEEANGADAPTKNAGKADPQPKLKRVAGDKPDEDLGEPVVDPESEKKGPATAADKTTKDSSASSKAAVAAEPQKKVSEEKDEDDEEDNEEKPEEMSKEQLKAAVMKMAQEMSHGSKKSLQATYKMMASYGEGVDVDPALALDERIKDINVAEDVEVLMNADDNLSEEFKKKAATIFEAAVKSKIRSEVSRLEEEYKSELQSAISEHKEELEEKVDTYLNYVVQEWMTENELALDRGLKGEVAEEFIAGLKQLFEDHYIDVPDEKYDVLESQADRISELENKLNETIEQVANGRKEVNVLKREKAISESTSDLTETEVEKFLSIVEDVEFESEESFQEKLNVLKENYFPNQISNENVLTEEGAQDNVVTGTDLLDAADDTMARYIGAIGNSVKSAK